MCAIVAVAVAPARAQDPGAGAGVPTAEEILARSRAATGGDRRPETERELWSARVAGLDGTLETLRRGTDTASTMQFGPFRTARGIARGERWRQNENGETIVERAEPSQAEKPTAQTVARVRDPLDAWEVTTTFGSGHVQRLYYDVRTSYLVRSERTIAGHTTRTDFDDFRTDARGRTRPWHYAGGDDRRENDFDYRLVRDDLGPAVTENDVAVPRDRRALVEFPAGADTVRLPARIENDRVYVTLEIGGRALDFLLDTGASSITIDQSVAASLGLPVYGRSVLTVAGAFESGRVVVPLVTVGPLAMHDVAMRTAPYASSDARDRRIVGLLGFDFLDACAIKLEYAAGTVEAIRPGSFVAPAGANALDVRLNSGAPVARATVGDATGEDFILDTGAAFGYVVFQRFARAHPAALAPARDGRTHAGSGVGGSLLYRNVAPRRLTLGTSVLEAAPGIEALAPNALGFDNQDGLIGADILRRFTVYLDYAGARVYLAPPRP